MARQAHHDFAVEYRNCIRDHMNPLRGKLTDLSLTEHTENTEKSTQNLHILGKNMGLVMLQFSFLTPAMKKVGSFLPCIRISKSPVVKQENLIEHNSQIEKTAGSDDDLDPSKLAVKGQKN